MPAGSELLCAADGVWSTLWLDKEWTLGDGHRFEDVTVVVCEARGELVRGLGGEAERAVGGDWGAIVRQVNHRARAIFFW